MVTRPHNCDRIDIQPSRLLLYIILGLHLSIAVIIASMFTFSLFIRLLLLLVISISLAYYYQKYGAEGKFNSIEWIDIDQNGYFFIEACGNYEKVTLLKSSFVSNWLLIANFQDQKLRKYSILITYDSVSHEAFRKMKIRLR